MPCGEVIPETAHGLTSESCPVQSHAGICTGAVGAARLACHPLLRPGAGASDGASAPRRRGSTRAGSLSADRQRRSRGAPGRCRSRSRALRSRTHRSRFFSGFSSPPDPRTQATVWAISVSVKPTSTRNGLPRASSSRRRARTRRVWSRVSPRCFSVAVGTARRDRDLGLCGAHQRDLAGMRLA